MGSEFRLQAAGTDANRNRLKAELQTKMLVTHMDSLIYFFCAQRGRLSTGAATAVVARLGRALGALTYWPTDVTGAWSWII